VEYAKLFTSHRASFCFWNEVCSFRGLLESCCSFRPWHRLWRLQWYGAEPRARNGHAQHGASPDDRFGPNSEVSTRISDFRSSPNIGHHSSERPLPKSARSRRRYPCSVTSLVSLPASSRATPSRSAIFNPKLATTGRTARTKLSLQQARRE
jgi:hypothetical protein